MDETEVSKGLNLILEMKLEKGPKPWQEFQQLSNTNKDLKWPKCLVWITLLGRG